LDELFPSSGELARMLGRSAVPKCLFYGAIGCPTTSVVVLPFPFFFLGLRWAGQVALGLDLLPTPHSTLCGHRLQWISWVCASFLRTLFFATSALGGCVSLAWVVVGRFVEMVSGILTMWSGGRRLAPSPTVVGPSALSDSRKIRVMVNDFLIILQGDSLVLTSPSY